LHCRNTLHARSACKRLKRKNRDEGEIITWNGGALVARLMVTGGDGGVAAMADGGCCFFFFLLPYAISPPLMCLFCSSPFILWRLRCWWW